MKMKTPPQMRGHAGEMFVCAELMRRGWFAALTARGSQSFDILASRADASVADAHVVRIRVKTGHGTFMWISKKKSNVLFLDMRDSGDFSVIVDLPDESAPDYYIIPTPELEKILQESYQCWKDTPGKNERPHQDTTMRTICIDNDESKVLHGFAVKLAPYHRAWNLLG